MLPPPPNIICCSCCASISCCFTVSYKESNKSVLSCVQSDRKRTWKQKKILWCLLFILRSFSVVLWSLSPFLGVNRPLAFGDAFQIVPMLFCVIRSNLKKNFSWAINTRERVLKVNLHYTWASFCICSSFSNVTDFSGRSFGLHRTKFGMSSWYSCPVFGRTSLKALVFVLIVSLLIKLDKYFTLKKIRLM